MNISTTNQKKMTYNTIGILRGSIEDGTYTAKIVNSYWHLIVKLILILIKYAQIDMSFWVITVIHGLLGLWILPVVQPL